MKIELQVMEEMFAFTSEQQWINKAQSWFRNSGVPKGHYICTDAKGRICTIGKHFMRATAEDTYPITCYRTH